MIWYLLSTISLVFITVVMFMRANDLRLRKKGWHWQIRLLGFVLAGCMPIGIIVTDASVSPYEALFRVGLAFVFFTTPYQVPFWTWLTRGEE